MSRAVSGAQQLVDIRRGGRLQQAGEQRRLVAVLLLLVVVHKEWLLQVKHLLLILHLQGVGRLEATTGQTRGELRRAAVQPTSTTTANSICSIEEDGLNLRRGVVHLGGGGGGAHHQRGGADNVILSSQQAALLPIIVGPEVLLLLLFAIEHRRRGGRADETVLLLLLLLQSIEINHGGVVVVLAVLKEGNSIGRFGQPANHRLAVVLILIFVLPLGHKLLLNGRLKECATAGHGGGVVVGNEVRRQAAANVSRGGGRSGGKKGSRGRNWNSGGDAVAAVHPIKGARVGHGRPTTTATAALQ